MRLLACLLAGLSYGAAAQACVQAQQGNSAFPNNWVVINGCSNSVQVCFMGHMSGGTPYTGCTGHLSPGSAEAISLSVDYQITTQWCASDDVNSGSCRPNF